MGAAASVADLRTESCPHSRAGEKTADAAAAGDGGDACDGDDVVAVDVDFGNLP